MRLEQLDVGTQIRAEVAARPERDHQRFEPPDDQRDDEDGRRTLPRLGDRHSAPDESQTGLLWPVPPQISVVIPCLDEEAAVGAVVDQAWLGIERSGLSGEVIVVDNGSTDRSAEIASARGATVV